MEWRKDDYLITDDNSKVQLGIVHRLLAATYWGGRRPQETVERMMVLQTRDAQGLYEKFGFSGNSARLRGSCSTEARRRASRCCRSTSRNSSNPASEVMWPPEKSASIWRRASGEKVSFSGTIWKRLLVLVSLVRS